MSSRSADFNYKVALASGLRSLQGGRLHQAEEQFRYLVQHFPGADGGYRGLAKVLVEQGDPRAALKVLLEGGAALAKAGERAHATALYREAVAMDEHDLAAHRRLAAALALAGDEEAAAQEYVRYVRAAAAAGDMSRAQLEAAYALERMPGNAAVAAATREAGADRDAHETSSIVPETPNTTRETPSTAPTAERGPVAHVYGGEADTAVRDDPWATSAPTTGGWGAPAPAEPAPSESIGADVDTASVEARAATYIARGDPRGAQAAIEAARRYIAGGHVDAASDLLLQLIAAGIADHDAQRLLVEVTKSLGKEDLASVKLRLLVEALRLDGHTELAAEVEQQARTG